MLPYLIVTLGVIAFPVYAFLSIAEIDVLAMFLLLIVSFAVLFGIGL